MALRILVALLGAFFLVQGLVWLADPKAAAAALGMPLLEGIGRSTQIGDLAAFFLCLGGMACFGAYRMAPTWIRAAGCLLAAAAITRTLAWLLHETGFPTQFVAIEAVCGGLLFFAASRMEGGTHA